jgi:hypothetical protein
LQRTFRLWGFSYILKQKDVFSFFCKKNPRRFSEKNKIPLPRKQEELNASNIEFHCDILNKFVFKYLQITNARLPTFSEPREIKKS